MYVVYVQVQVNPESVDAFIEATGDNHRETRKEPGNMRFDLLRDNEEPTRFFLYEVYLNEEGFKAHQQTAHYLRWRERVAPYMAVPRKANRLTSVFPDPWT